jgi:hypothetical protein
MRLYLTENGLLVHTTLRQTPTGAEAQQPMLWLVNGSLWFSLRLVERQYPMRILTGLYQMVRLHREARQQLETGRQRCKSLVGQLEGIEYSTDSLTTSASITEH